MIKLTKKEFNYMDDTDKISFLKQVKSEIRDQMNDKEWNNFAIDYFDEELLYDITFSSDQEVETVEDFVKNMLGYLSAKKQKKFNDIKKVI